MKKKIIFSLVISLVPFLTFASSDFSSEVSLDRESFVAYQAFIQKAVENPLTPVQVNEQKKVVSQVSLFKTRVETKKTFIIFDDVLENMALQEESEENEVFSLLFLLPLLSLVLMVLADERFFHKRKNLSRLILTAASLILAFAFCFIPVENFIVRTSMVMSAGSALINMGIIGRTEANIYQGRENKKEEEDNKKIFSFFSIVFYVATMLSFMFLALA